MSSPMAMFMVLLSFKVQAEKNYRDKHFLPERLHAPPPLANTPATIPINQEKHLKLKPSGQPRRKSLNRSTFPRTKHLNQRPLT